MEQGRRPVADGGGAAPAVRGGGEQVWELHGAMRKLSWGSIWVKEGRRRGFDGELERRAAMAARRRRSGPGMARLGLVREGEWRGRVERLLAKQMGRGRARQEGA